MKAIKGVVCIAVIDRAEVLFGKNMERGQGHYESLQSNGLTSFADYHEARVAADELRKRKDVCEVSVAILEMTLAETAREAFAFRRKRSLVAVRQIPESRETILIGAPVGESFSRYPLYGALLEENGLRPFTSFRPAMYTAQEEARQTQCPVSIATFKLKRL